MAEIEVRVSELERNVDRVMTKLDMFIEESRAARQRQDAEMREARQKHDADMCKFHDDCANREVLPSIDRLRKRVNTLTIINLLGYATIVVAVFLK